jgi:Trypsin
VEGNARVEQRRGHTQLQQVLLSWGAVALTLATTAGCWGPTRRASIAVPAARQQDEGRPLNLLPPVKLTSLRDAVVRIVGDGNVTCTGTLIADDRVLTAHHCVSQHDARGRAQSTDMAPEDVQIELGGDDLPWGEVNVRAIVAPRCGFVAGDGDIAILVLERHLIGMPTSAARLEAPPERNEDIRVFGFGRCALSHTAIHRAFRDTSAVESIAPGQFQAHSAICPGDSGGPVYDNKDDIIGVVSASVMDGDEHTQGQSLFTRVDVWPQLFSAAHEISLGASPSELPPYGDCHPLAPRPPAR